MKNVFFLLALLSFTIIATAASADPIHEALAKPWQLGFSAPATPVMERLDNIHDFLLVIITLISLFVLALMVYICVRFRRKANPSPSHTTHNTKLEIIWTVIPVLILVAIAIPSLRIHFFMQHPVEPEMTLKVTGYQWYWHYDYPDHGGFGFDSYMKKDNELAPGDHRLLAVDNRVVVPVDTTVRVLMTGADVIHAWAVPTFGVKKDAVPGRLNETWFKATKTGTFFGQCSELCGVGHGFMPIVVDVVSKEEFAEWVTAKQKEAGIDPAALSEDKALRVKEAMPVTPAVPATQEDPDPVTAKEKEMSAPEAKEHVPPRGEDSKYMGEGNQPKPSRAAEEAGPDNEEQ